MTDPTETPARRRTGLQPIDYGLIAAVIGIGIAALLPEIIAAAKLLPQIAAAAALLRAAI